MTEPRCIHCKFWEIDGSVPLANRLAEERALQAQYGENVGLAGGCEHPGYKRIGRLSTATCGMWEEARDDG